MSLFDFHVKSNSDKIISPSDYVSKLEDGEAIILIDVRRIDEYRYKRIPEAVHVPLSMIDRIGDIFPDRYQTYVLYCEHGVRSNQALAIMTKLGYSNVFDMGGMETWPGEIESDF